MPSSTRNPSSTINWFDGANVVASDDAYASYFASVPALSTPYFVRGYGFSIPGGAMIDGFELDVERKASHDSGGEYITDFAVQLTNESGTATGDNKADTVTHWPTSDATKTYGGAADDWNYTAQFGGGPTPASVNNTSFGMVLRVEFFPVTSTLTAFVDHIPLTVTYSLVAGGGSTAGSFLLGMIAPRKLISFPNLWTPRPRPVFQYCQRRRAVASHHSPLTTHHSPLTI